MRKIIIIIGIFLVACSKDKGSAPNNLNTYRVTVKENFTDPLKQLENIQVDDYVPYTITLTDSKEGGEYRLTSLKEGERYHQTIGKDFVLSLTNDPKTPINKEQKYLSFSSKGTHSFYIRPLVPGTFKLTFELQKYVGDKAVGDAIKVNVSFNAVEIKSAYTELMLHPPRPDRHQYCLVIYDGGEEGDTYLSSNGTTLFCNVTFIINGKEESKEGEYRVGDYFLLQKSESSELIVTIKNVKIIKKSDYYPDFIIEYPNLNISNQ